MRARFVRPASLGEKEEIFGTYNYRPRHDGEASNRRFPLIHTITIPELPHGRGATFLKALALQLLADATRRTPAEHIPDGHEAASEAADETAREIIAAVHSSTR